MTTDPIMAEIFAGIALIHRGERVTGKRALEAVWARISKNPEPIHECTLSHYLADVQDDLVEELAWDVRALYAALRCTDADAQRHSQSLSIAAFMPSLHVNLADDYFRLGDLARAREHLASARDVAGNLSDDPYGRMIRRGMEHLAAQLEAAEAPPQVRAG